MRILTTLACFLAANSAAAGVTYDFQSFTKGVRDSALVGTVAVEGSNMRVDVTNGDDLLLKKNALVLSNDGGNTLSIFDRSTKTYYVVNVNSLTGAASGFLNTFGGMFKLSFSNPHVNIRDLGDGGAVSGFATRHAVVEASFDFGLDAAGSAVKSHITVTTESWTTDQVSGAASSFLQMNALHTGYADLDKLIDAESKPLQGRFPLKQITTIRGQQGAGDISSTTSSEVSHIEKKTIAAEAFAAPAGFNKVDDPVTRMMKNLK